jgi:hypothetical protein
MKKNLIITPLLLLIASTTVLAQGFRGVYVGGSIGSSFVNANYTDIETEDLKIDSNNLAYKIYGGLPFGGFLGLEGGYVSTGKAKDKIEDITLTTKTTGFDVLAVGAVDISILHIFGKVGIFFWNTENTAEADPESSFLPTDGNEKVDGQDLAWGFGAEIRLGKLGIRGEWEKFEVGNPDKLSMLSAGVVILF